MGADVSRIRFNPLLDYSGVELQQGRVVLDGDFNELVAVLDRRGRAAASDVLGRSAVSATTPDAFKVAATPGALAIGTGRLYVDGLVAENHGAPSADPAKVRFDPVLAETQFTDPVAYDAQPYLPAAPPLPQAGQHLVYLDVWDREVTPLERPDLVELALGVDTSTRRQTVWQVRILEGDASGVTCETPDNEVNGWSALTAPSAGRLTTGTYDVPPEEDPCELPPSGGYRGLENQTYRVEIHDGGAVGAATFMWSRESASIGSRVDVILSGTELELQTLGRDEVLRFNSGDWVEIIDDRRELSQRGGEMRRVTVNEEARRITFAPPLPAEMIPSAFPDTDFPRDRNLRMRRWDQTHKVLRAAGGGATEVFEDLDAGTAGVIPVPPEGTVLLLENGITVSFSTAGPGGFHAGDYWVFAARTADASIESLEYAPPRGIHHHYARLGIWDIGAGTVTDCRHQWPPAGGGDDCGCTACVTPRSHATGTLTIQDAVNAVRETGGTVCLSAGEYALKEPVRVVGARSVRIRGQGPATVVASAGAVFTIRTSAAIAIEHLSVMSLGKQSAISVATAAGLILQHLAIDVVDPTGDARGAAISLQGVVTSATIRDNAITARVGLVATDPTPLPSIGDAPVPDFLITTALAIEDNRFSCARQAIALGGSVQHAFGTRIARNHVLECADVGIAALGIGAPGSTLTVSHNHIAVAGGGIRCSVGDLAIEGNTVVCSKREAAISAAAGIAVVTGRDKSGIERCQVLSNRVSGFGGPGIAIATPTRELLIKQNIVTDCANGILCSEDANAVTLAIENNQLRDIGRADAPGAPSVVGIGVTRADAATIAGNMIRSVGLKTVQSAYCAGVMTFAVGRARVSGNEVTAVAPAGDFVGTGAGVMLHAPYAEFEVSHNQVRRDDVALAQPGNALWSAVLATDIDPRIPVSRLGEFTIVRLDLARTLVLGPGGPFVSTTGGLIAGTGAEPVPAARGAVLGNAVSGRGPAPAIDVAASGECLVADNRVEAHGNRQAAVLIASGVAIVHANRVRSADQSIEVTGATAAAVLGNVTTGSITLPGGLLPPWNALNLRA